MWIVRIIQYLNWKKKDYQNTRPFRIGHIEHQWKNSATSPGSYTVQTKIHPYFKTHQANFAIAIVKGGQRKHNFFVFLDCEIVLKTWRHVSLSPQSWSINWNTILYIACIIPPTLYVAENILSGQEQRHHVLMMTNAPDLSHDATECWSTYSSSCERLLSRSELSSSWQQIRTCLTTCWVPGTVSVQHIKDSLKWKFLHLMENHFLQRRT